MASRLEIFLSRFYSSDQGTLGILFIPDIQFACYSLELPWRDNRPDKSCIPSGKYDVVPCVSSRFGRTYLVKNVPNRSAILIHQGNLAGDTDLGYKSHSRGCILLGQKIGLVEKQKAILLSVSALTEFKNIIGENGFLLNIRGVNNA